jgi:carbamoyl-phosphate synthase small subunit
VTTPLDHIQGVHADLLVRGAHVLDQASGLDQRADILVRGGTIAAIGDALDAPDGCEVVDGAGLHALPAFVDPHVHLRTPGREGDETIATGTAAAAAGGYCAVLAQPNTEPVTDSVEVLRALRSRARAEAVVPTGFLAAVTIGQRGEELTELGLLADAGAVGFTDDGLPITDAGVLRRALQLQRIVDLPIALHEEDPALSAGGCMHEGSVSAALGVTGIPSISESAMIARDAAIAGHEGGRIHIQHVSAAESVVAIEQARDRGVRITAEVSPHHLTLTHEAVGELDTNAKMNPPLRTERDRAALVDALRRGVIDCIATDHAPHALHRKQLPFEDAPVRHHRAGDRLRRAAHRPGARRRARPAGDRARPDGRRRRVRDRAPCARGRHARQHHARRPRRQLARRRTRLRQPLRQHPVARPRAARPGRHDGRRRIDRPPHANARRRRRRRMINMADRDAAYLLLEDGTRFDGDAAGARGEVVGEVVFTTAMGGYQESVTDPSFRAQILVFTAPHVGNYGVCDAAMESGHVHVRGVVMREAVDHADVPGVDEGWLTWLRSREVPGITGIDTRALVRCIRDRGSMRGGIFSAGTAQADALERIHAEPSMDGRNLALEVTPPQVVHLGAGNAGPHIAAIDTGIKTSIVRNLLERGVRLDLHPCTATADELLAGSPDGLFLANGPGDPAALDDVVQVVRECVGRLPVLGICMGHQLLSRAIGLETFKLPFGHRGTNHPVKDLVTGRIDITSQNHGFAVRGPDGAERIEVHEPVRWETDFGTAELSHVSLYDRTVEGLVLRDVPGATVQYHPEAGLDHTTRCTCSTAAWSSCDDPTHRHLQDHGARLGPDRDRPGRGVRLLRCAGLQGAAGRGLRGRARQLQPGHDHDRSGVRDHHLRRAAHPRVGAARDRARAPRRAAAHARRGHGAQPRARPGRGRHARGVRRRADRRRLRRHPARRGPRAVQPDDGRGRAARAALGDRALARRRA